MKYRIGQEVQVCVYGTYGSERWLGQVVRRLQNNAHGFDYEVSCCDGLTLYVTSDELSEPQRVDAGPSWGVR